MSARVAVYGYLLLVQFLFLGLGASATWAQVDPTKVLVGTWIGHAEVNRDSERALVIRSVKPKDGGGWIADGSYGYTVEKMGRRPIDVSLEGSDIILEFLTPPLNNPVRLKLVGENRLEGTANFVITGRTTTRALKLEKVESKKEQSK